MRCPLEFRALMGILSLSKYPLKMTSYLQWESEGIAFRLEDIMNQTETKSVLKTTDIASHLKLEPSSITNNELQRDYDYFRAQEVAKTLLDSGLISLSEFNKLSLKNRETFSPFWVEILPEIR